MTRTLCLCLAPALSAAGPKARTRRQSPGEAGHRLPGLSISAVTPTDIDRVYTVVCYYRSILGFGDCYAL
ncbi:MAG: hypothetical protein OXG44_20505, partial [Gammaproteobacteria bacterium]|nr:hypothetical protein [Gammaproteobacteria bacterium]